MGRGFESHPSLKNKNNFGLEANGKQPDCLSGISESCMRVRVPSRPHFLFGCVEQLAGLLDCKSSSLIRHVGSNPTTPTFFKKK